jgi:FlaA1/EpsC-like NDP-sugar epimerase
LFLKQIEAGGPVTVTHSKIERYFMTIPEASQLVLQASSLSKGGEIFMLEMGERVKVLDLAKRMIKLAGFEPGKEIEIKFVGLRPGEKLIEELKTKHEKREPTEHEKISRIISPNKDDIESFVDELFEISSIGNENKILDKLKEID